MKHSYRIVALMLSLFLLASLPTASAARKEAPVKPDLKLLDIKAWDEAVYKLVHPPTENGNAAPYLFEAIHSDFMAQKETGSKMPYSWWAGFKFEDLESDAPEKVAIKADAIKIPELDLLVKASLQNDYRWVGIIWAPSPNAYQSLFELKEPFYLDIWRLALILAARADDKLARGDKSGAEADMTAAFRVGHIMEKDVWNIGFIISMAIELRVAGKMPAFYRKLGDEVKAKAWEEFLPALENRRDTVKAVSRYFSGMSTFEELAAMTNDPTLPRSIRLEAMVMAIWKDSFLCPLRIMVGASGKSKKFVTSEHFDDPEMVILQFKLIEDIYAGQLSGTIGRRKLRGMAKALK